MTPANQKLPVKIVYDSSCADCLEIWPKSHAHGLTLAQQNSCYAAIQFVRLHKYLRIFPLAKLGLQRTSYPYATNRTQRRMYRAAAAAAAAVEATVVQYQPFQLLDKKQRPQEAEYTNHARWHIKKRARSARNRARVSPPKRHVPMPSLHRLSMKIK